MLLKYSHSLFYENKRRRKKTVDNNKSPKRATQSQARFPAEVSRSTPGRAYREWMSVSAFRASVSQESVRASISALSCSQASLLAGPSRPEELKARELFPHRRVRSTSQIENTECSCSSHPQTLWYNHGTSHKLTFTCQIFMQCCSKHGPSLHSWHPFLVITGITSS